MITLYRVSNCDACDEVQETLRELVVAHQVVDVEKVVDAEKGDTQKPVPMNGATATQELPVIADGDKVVHGKAALRDYLAELAQEMEEWRKFQVDACYIDDKGKTC